MARELFLEGNARFDQSDYPGALDAYQRADEIMRVPTTGYKVGKTLVALGRLLEARDKLVGVTLLPRQLNESAAFAHAREQAARLADEVRERIPSLSVSVSGPPAGGFQLSIDGDLVAAAIASSPLRLNPGRHVVRAQAAGYIASERVVELRERDAVEIHLALLAEGSEPPPEPAGISPLVWTGFGVAAAGIVVGSITGVMSLKKASKLDDSCPAGSCPPDAESDIDSAYATATASTIAFIVAGVGAGVGVTGLLLSDFGSPDAQAWLAPGYLSVRLRF